MAMASSTISRSVPRALRQTATSFAQRSSRRTATLPLSQRCSYHISNSPLTASHTQRRPTPKPFASVTPRTSQAVEERRTIFIQTEETPNADALKFNPNTRILPESINSPYLEYLSPRSTLAPPHPSPLAAQLMNVDGVTSVFFAIDSITVSKDSSVPWAHVKPEVFSIINEFIMSGQAIVKTVESGSCQPEEVDSLAYNENDTEVVGMIKELLETRIRPAIQEDGGDIEFRGFDEESGTVLLKLRGACRTCDSSTVTLKNGIESMLQHYIPEVQEVKQIMDQEEEIALQEFAKFEEKLRKQKGLDSIPSTVGKGSLDTVE